MGKEEMKNTGQMVDREEGIEREEEGGWEKLHALYSNGSAVLH